jgi:Holliday junction resolvase-like predicted endonuclease
MQLGPSGYPFEKFIARLLDHLGYQTQTQVILKGKCIDHEIDVIAKKDNQSFMVECKYHNRPGTKSRSKDVLYTQARFEDLVDHFDHLWLVTNTKLTTNAIKYGQCQGMKLIAWRYPTKGSLEQLIEDNNLHPLTCLSFLDRHDRQMLFQDNLVLCRDLAKAGQKKLTSLGLNSAKIKSIHQALSNLKYN